MNKKDNYEIVKLTKEQIDFLPGFRDAWLKVALSTEQVDRQAAERGFKQAYETIGESTPKVEWLASPLKGTIAATILSEDKRVGEIIGKKLWAAELDRARKVVMEKISPSVLFPIKTALMDPIAERMASVVVPIALELEQRTSALKMEGSEQIVREFLGKAVFGSFDAGWFSFYDYIGRVLDIKECKRLKGLFMAAKAGWYWPFKNIVIATEHPTKILFDENLKPHCESALAIEYPDGFGTCCWHGTRVPQESIFKPNDVKWADVETTADRDLKDALAEIKALHWSKTKTTAEKTEASETDEHYQAAMAVKRLGGVSSLKDMVEADDA
jgi:hypothetical protein